MSNVEMLNVRKKQKMHKKKSSPKTHFPHSRRNLAEIENFREKNNDDTGNSQLTILNLQSCKECVLQAVVLLQNLKKEVPR